MSAQLAPSQKGWSRTRSVVATLLFVPLLIGARCGGSSSSPANAMRTVTLKGTDAPATVTATEQTNLVQRINTYRAGLGLLLLTQTTIVDQVADQHATQMAVSGLTLDTLPSGRTVLGELLARGENPGQEGYVYVIKAVGFSSANSLINAMQNDETIKTALQGRFTRIGVGVSLNPVQGNFWSVILY